MELFKSIGSALSFSNDSKHAPQQSSSVLGGAPSTAGGGAAIKSNPFGAAFGDPAMPPPSAGGKVGGKGASPKPARKSSSSAKSAASPKKLSSPAGGTSTSKVKKDDKATSEGGREDVDDNGLAGGIEKALNSVGRSLSRSLNFKSSASQEAGGLEKKKSMVASTKPAAPAVSAAFSKFDVSPEEEAQKKKAGDATGPGSAAEPRKTAPSGEKRSGTFGSNPIASLSALKASEETQQKQKKTANGDPFESRAAAQSQAQHAEDQEHASLLHGTSRVKYHGTSVVQGNTIHFLVVVVQQQLPPAQRREASATTGSDGAAAQRSLALIGLLDPLGTVRASTKATVERCDAIRKIERVRISPREAELSLLGTAVPTSSGSASSGKSTNLLLVDPAQAAVLGVLVPFLRRVPGVSAVDGFKADYWTAADATGTHRVPLFDVEGPVDDLNAIAVLRLRCHTLKVEDATLPGTPRVEVSTQTLNDARTLLHDDFDAELESLKKLHRQELDALRADVAKLQQQLEWKLSESKELSTTSRAREEAMTAEIAELKRLLSMRLAATQTSTPPELSRSSSATHEGSASGPLNVERVGEHDYSTGASVEQGQTTESSRLHRAPTQRTGGTDRSATGDELDVGGAGDRRMAPKERAPVFGSLTKEVLDASTAQLHHQDDSSIAYPTDAARVAAGKERFSVHVYEPTLQSTMPLGRSVPLPEAKKDDPLAAVRAKLAQSEAFLRQARSGGAAGQNSRAPYVTPPAAAQSPVVSAEEFHRSSLLSGSTSAIRSPAQVMRPATSGRR